MNIKVKEFDELNGKEMYEILKIRQDVFIVEQNCIYHDIDAVDQESVHMFLEDTPPNSQEDSKSIQAYLRLFYKKDNNVEIEELKTEPQIIVQMGRVVTVTRGNGYGKIILEEGIRVAKEEMKAKGIYIEAQTYAIQFYAREGFEVISEEFLEDGIPHVKMMLWL